MSSNHLIIGLGGTGGRIIRSLRKIIYRDGNCVEPDGVNLQYLYIDSSDEMMGANDHSWRVVDKSVQLQAGDQIHLDGADLSARLKNINSFPQIRGWIGDVELWKDILNLGSGETKVMGGQKRILGRFLFSCHVEEFLNRLNTKMTALRTSVNSTTSAVTVHIFSGLAGGTGSGCLIDVIAQIRSRYPSKDCKIHVYVLLPERYPKAGWKKFNYHANGYAALAELNALSVGKYAPYDLAGHGDRLKGLSGPFQACYVITNENDTKMEFDVQSEVPESIAMFLYQKVVAGADGKWPDLARIEEWENQSLEPEHGERSRLFLSFGLKQITYPEEEIKDYLSYALAKQSCLQLLYNNWEQSYAAEPAAFNADSFVLQHQVMTRWCITREHLSLEKRFSHDEIDAEQEKWRPMQESWKSFVDQIYEDVASTEDGNVAAILRRKCKERFESGFAGGEGVKGFYHRRSSRVEEYAETILGVIEQDLMKDVFAGKQSLTACEGILNALAGQFKSWLGEWKEFCEKAVREAAKAKSRLDNNVEEFESMGTLARMFGLRGRILQAAKDNACQYFTNASIAESYAFVETFVRALEQRNFAALDLLKKTTATLHRSVAICSDKCSQLKPRDSDKANDRDNALKGVWVRIFDAREVESHLTRLTQDQEFQALQASRARDAIKDKLLQGRLSFARSASVGVENLLDCLTQLTVKALREVNDAVGVEKPLNRLLSVSIVDKLNERYNGKEELMRQEIEVIIKTARDFVQFNGAEIARRGLGVKVEGVMEEAFAIAMPEAGQHEVLMKQFQQASQRQIRWVDTKQRRRHEITLLKFTQLFPLRLLSAVEFLREEYNKAVTTSNNPSRTRLELHTEGDLSNYPPLFIPDPTQRILPRILLGLASQVIVPQTSDPAQLELLFDRTKGASERVTGRHSLGRGYSQAVGTLNVGTIGVGMKEPPESESIFSVLEREIELTLQARVTDERRTEIKKRVVGLVDELVLQGGESRDDLGLAAAAALQSLEARWKGLQNTQGGISS